MTDPAETAATLRQAADIMEKGGIARGILGPMDTEDAPHCMLGAIYTASEPPSFWGNPAVAALAEFLPIPTEGIMDPFNASHVYPNSADVHKVAAFSNMVSKDAAAAACMMRGAAEYLEEKEKLNAENQ